MRFYSPCVFSLALLLAAAFLSGCTHNASEEVTVPGAEEEDCLDALDNHVITTAHAVTPPEDVTPVITETEVTPAVQPEPEPEVTVVEKKSEPTNDVSWEEEKTKEDAALSDETLSPQPPPPVAPAPVVPMVLTWFTDFEEARIEAAQTGRDVMVAFVANDSFPWSQRLEADVFSRPAFAVIANKKFVAVMVDFPKTYSLTPAQAKKNTDLRKTWGVRSLPTIILADARGRPYAVTGYRNMGAADYARHLESLQQIREQRDQYFSAAQEAEGIPRAILLAQGLRLMDEDVILRHYTAELSELRHIDPMDATGLAGDIAFTPKLDSLREKVVRLIREKKDYDGALKAVDNFIAYEAPVGEHLQKALFLKLNVYANPNPEVLNHGAVIQLMDQIIAINPLSEQGMMAVDVRARANALIAGPKMMPSRE